MQGYRIGERDSEPLYDARIEMDGTTIILFSRGGGSAGRGTRNPDYSKALRTIIRRLRRPESDSGLVIDRVLIDSLPAHSRPVGERVLLGAEQLLGMTDDETVKTIQNAAGAWGQATGTKGRNRTKRLRIETQGRSHHSLVKTLRLHKWPQDAGAPISLTSRDPRKDGALLRDILSGIETASSDYAIRGLQEFRTRNRLLKRRHRTIFGSEPNNDEWAFHLGGRDELQFNVGFENLADGSRIFRSGVAFSLEPSRSLPDIGSFFPKIRRFNEWLGANGNSLAGLTMWHWQSGVRSPDYSPIAISDALAKQGTFIFLGTHVPATEIDISKVLPTFDRLFPLYRYVEDAGKTLEIASAQPDLDELLETLFLDAGREISGKRWTRASIAERIIDVELRHLEIQRRLKAQLLEEGFDRVTLEASVGRRLIDAVAQKGSELHFFEVKTSSSVRICIREALGQLLEYALWPGATRPARLVIVGEAVPDKAALAYLDTLNSRFPLHVEYRSVPIDDG